MMRILLIILFENEDSPNCQVNLTERVPPDLLPPMNHWNFFLG